MTITSSAIAVTFLAFFAVALYRRTYRHLPLPPGPPGYPLVGNVFDSIGLRDWRAYSDLRARWGDLTTLSVFGQPIVFAHTYEKAAELLDKKSLIYSGRATVQMFALGGLQDHVSELQYGSQLRECRRMLRSEINPVRVKSHNGLQEAMSRRFLRSLLASPEQFYDLIEWFSGSVVLKITYGYDTLDKNDPMIEKAHKVTSDVDVVTAPGYLIELIPWLRYLPDWFPFTGFKRDALKLKQDYITAREAPFKYTLSTMDTQEGGSSFVAYWIKKIESEQQLLYLKHVATIFFAAGVDTTSSVLLSFFFRMQEHSDIVKRAQAEIDAVVGSGRLPTFEDEPRLPYIRALCKELLRHNVPAPAGVPHMSTADDIHDGFYLPKGTIIVACLWEMSRDPAVYKNPDAFNPERFLGPSPERDPSLYIFGFGRRICPGLSLAKDTIFIAVATVLAAFDVMPASSSGPETDMKLAQGMINHPLPFQCRLSPRAGMRDEILRETPA